MYHDDGLSLPFQALEQLDDDPFRPRVHAAKRFVHQVEVRLLGQGPGQEGPLLLAAGELADLPIGELGHTHLLQRLHGDPAVRSPRAPEPSQVAVAPHQHHVADRGRKIPVHAAALRHVGDPLRVDADLARHGPHQLQHGLDQGALARSVGADDRGQAPPGNVEVHVPEHRLDIVGDGQVLDLESPGVLFTHLHFYPSLTGIGDHFRAFVMVSTFAFTVEM